MFSAARLAALFVTFSYIFTSALAASEILFTSSVTYCAPPEAILVEKLDIKYYNNNQSVFFNISAAAVDTNISVSAAILLNVYGLTPVNLTIDLCDLAGGALCPLPQLSGQTFQASDTLSIGSLLDTDIASIIPGIAFLIPDLEGYAQASLIEVGTGAVKACVQATLSNGHSTQQIAAAWSTGGLAIATLLLAIWQSLSTESLLPYRLVDLLLLYQSIAASAFLNINYPSIYRSFTYNFAWALGLLSSSPSPIQDSIDSMRALTGGSLPNSTSESAVGFVNRKLSPFNTAATTGGSSGSGFSSSSIFLASPEASMSSKFGSFITTYAGLSKRADDTDASSVVQTVTATSDNVLDAGVPVYVNSVNIGTANAFMTVFLTALCMAAIAIACFGLVRVALLSYRRPTPLHRNYNAVVSAWSLRLMLIAFFPLLVFAFYQWTLHDSWLSILLSVFTFLGLLVGIAYATWRILQHRRAATLDQNEYSFFLRFAPLQGIYRSERFYFFFPIIFSAFLKCIFIAAGKNNGLAQVVLFLIVDVFMVALHVIIRPYKNKKGDVLNTFLAIARLICAGLNIAFLEQLDLTAIIRTIIGCVAGVVYSAAVIVLFFNIITNAVQDFLRDRRTKGTTSEEAFNGGPIQNEKTRRSSEMYSQSPL